jgi:hypothetical protein
MVQSYNLNTLWLEVRCYLILFVLLAVLCDDATLDPSRINIVTVVDPTSHEIVRDSLTFLRSLRLFGGLLNEATVTAYIPIDDENSLIDNYSTNNYSDNGILHQLSSLGAEIKFISQAIEPTPKTMNKFESMKYFDSIRFDYLLWLDADIVVLGDPISSGELKRHTHPGYYIHK